MTQDKISSTTGSCHEGCDCHTGPVGLGQENPTINNVALLHPGESVASDALRERAYGELLRQRAVALGMLSANAFPIAPTLSDLDQAAIEIMLDQEISVPEVSLEACERYYQAHPTRFIYGQRKQVRHILFAVTDGVDVRRLADRAETVLLELLDKNAAAGLFERYATDLSNCPSGARGGDLGWLTPQDCAPEFANELFFRAEAGSPTGLSPRLVHTRFGLHIVEVLADDPGTMIPFDRAKKGIATQLALQSRSNALRQYLTLLAGEAAISGIELDAAETPLVQ
jgi:peptidyl-prolyl cis-trans isomerase C